MPIAVGPYTPIVRVGDLLVCSGQIGQVEGKVVGGGLEAELRQTFTNLRDVLASENAALSDVVKATVFLIDMNDFASMNEIYLEEFGDHRPARSCVAVAALPLGASVEIEVLARA